MDEKVIVAFAKWMQTKDKQLAQVPTEQLAQQVIKALQTEEGQKQLQPLFQQFQTEMQGGMFKCGGKMDQAVKKMKHGSKTEKVEAPRDEIQYANDPRLLETIRKSDDAVYDGWRYHKIGDSWYQHEDFPEEGRVISPGEYAYNVLENMSYHFPSDKVLNAQRNFYSKHKHVSDEDGNTVYTLSTAAAIPDDQDKRLIADGLTLPVEIDSLITRNHGVNAPQHASNTDWSVRFYRHVPAFRKVADYFGYVPKFEQWKVMFDKRKK